MSFTIMSIHLTQSLNIFCKASTCLFLCLFLTIDSKAQYLDSLADGFIVGKLINKNLGIRIVPLNTKAWRNLNNYKCTRKSNTDLFDQMLTLSSANTWPKNVDSFSIQATSYKLNFDSDEKIIEELPKDDNGNNFSYTHNEIEDLRYLFNFLACNQNFSVAQLNGLGFTEPQKEINAIIYFSIPTVPNILPFSIKDGRLPPSLKPPTPFYSISDQQILFEWPALPFFYQYYGFQLERSLDGKKYSVLNNGPIINFHSGEKVAGFRSYFSFQDTLLHGKTIYYRLRGLDYFGGQSDPGDPLIIRVPMIIPAPFLIGYNLQINSLRLNWELDTKYENNITSFNIWVSDSVNGEDKRMVKSNVDKKLRTVTINNVHDKTVFYFVEVIRPDAPGKFSFPIMVIKPDSKPPSPPDHLAADMNEKGIVSITWSPNQESDFLGYRLFRSVDSLSEFALLVDTLLNNHQYTDTVPINTLTKRIFYRAAAVDQNFNLSKLSNIIGVQIFDTIRPSQPVFYQYTPLTSGILLKWYPSMSNDVDKTFLYKRQKNPMSEWEVLKSTDSYNLADSIIDLNVTSGVLYEYSLASIDYSGNLSLPARPLIAKPLYAAFLPQIEIFKGEYHKEKKQLVLEWQYNESDILEYWIYKNKGNEAPSLFKQISSALYRYEDIDIVLNADYTYFIKAVHENGRESKLSKPLLFTIN